MLSILFYGNKGYKLDTKSLWMNPEAEKKNKISAPTNELNKQLAIN